MYVEFYGIPGAGKTTVAEHLNKMIYCRPSLIHFPGALVKTAVSYSKFHFFTKKEMFNSDFLKKVIRHPIFFTGFMKAVFVRFYTLFRYEKSGLFISDHGLIQTLSQNNVFRSELLTNVRFQSKILKLIPRNRNLLYIHLKSNKEQAYKRIIRRENKVPHNADFFEECTALFKIIEKKIHSKIISAQHSRETVEKTAERYIKSKLF